MARRGDRRYLVLKRALDLAGGLCGTVLFCVLYLPVAALIKLDSPGPALFAQLRVGKDGQLFRTLKFRSMRVGSRGRVPTGLSDGDDRVTRVGRFLRRSGLDEIPQFLNVLRGEMSLVGPRPELPELFSRYVPWQRRRIEVLPGITGWWQVHGRPQPMIDHVHYDITYVERRSLAFDLCILLLTIPALMRPQAGCPPCSVAPGIAGPLRGTPTPPGAGRS